MAGVIAETSCELDSLFRNLAPANRVFLPDNPNLDMFKFLVGNLIQQNYIERLPVDPNSVPESFIISLLKCKLCHLILPYAEVKPGLPVPNFIIDPRGAIIEIHFQQ